MNEAQIHPASFRDPAGWVFLENGHYLRQVNLQYADAYEKLMQSGLYRKLVEKSLLIPHELLPEHKGVDGKAYRVLLPQQLHWISYPYEWTFEMLKDAALCTLAVQQCALEHGMTLKDASTYNIQFVHGKPVFIDTLSFDPYDASQPWVAYRQFCQHFLFPLLIAHYKGIPAQLWMELYIDGLPVELTASLLPWYSKFQLTTAMHVHLQKKLKSSAAKAAINGTFSSRKMQRLVQHLQEFTGRLKWPGTKSVWGDYYAATILSQEYLSEKTIVIKDFLSGIEVETAIDLGANAGYFSRLLLSRTKMVLAVDNDQEALNHLYHAIREDGKLSIQPLLTDLVNPSPGIGWRNRERPAFTDRFQGELVLALALVHHLYFSGGIPMPQIFELLDQLTTRYLIIEYPTLEDPKVIQIAGSKLFSREQYSEVHFEIAARQYFSIVKKIPITAGNRVLYLMQKN